MAEINFHLDPLQNDDEETRSESVRFSDFVSGIQANVRASQWLSSVSAIIPLGVPPPEYMAFLVLREFLQPTSPLSVNEAVQCLLEIFPKGNVEDEVVVIVSMDMAKQIPYHHSSHQKLARLLWSYGRSTARLDKGGWNSEVVQDFYKILTGDFTYTGLVPNDGDLEYPPDQYVNYLAFVAHVHAAGIFRPWSRIAIHLVTSGLESRHDAATSTVRDAWVLGAAQLILWYGQGLFNLILLPEELEPEPDYTVPRWLGAEPDARGPLTLKTWLVWREGFLDASESSDYGAECREVAKKAANIMDTLQKSMTF